MDSLDLDFGARSDSDSVSVGTSSSDSDDSCSLLEVTGFTPGVGHVSLTDLASQHRTQSEQPQPCSQTSLPRVQQSENKNPSRKKAKARRFDPREYGWLRCEHLWWARYRGHFWPSFEIDHRQLQLLSTLKLDDEKMETYNKDSPYCAVVYFDTKPVLHAYVQRAACVALGALTGAFT